MAPLKRPRPHPRRPRAINKLSSRTPIKHTRPRQKRDLPPTTPMAPSSTSRATNIRTRLMQENASLFTFSTPFSPLTIELQSPTTPAVDFLTECFQLVEATSAADYKASSIDWDPPSKLKEMKDKRMMYLLVRRGAPTAPDSPDDAVRASDTQSKQILGFLSFMFTTDDPPHTDRRVVYIYEVHLVEELRGVGLGSHLIGMAETAARKMGVSKTMLTVFSSNRKARGLYERLGYRRDQCSPADREIRGRVIEADYVIMGKELV